MKLCYVTDRKALPGTPEEQIRSLVQKVRNAQRAGVDWIQIREKDLDARSLYALVREVMPGRFSKQLILVNDRLDVALAAGAYGVHLGEESLRVADARQFWERTYVDGFLFGVSAHSVEAVEQAEADGADYVIFGPVFATPSKLAYGLPHGLQQLAAACRSVSIPVLAIGGITVENALQCAEAGAAGVAAVRLFQDADDIEAVVRALH
jgi:thiamine-phosphate pyrophosphorylase